MTAEQGAFAGAFVGRTRELAELLAGVEESIAGRGQVVLLTGEPGIGKTRLADELTRRASDAGARVLRARCWEGGGTPPYWLWTQVLRSCVDPATGTCGPGLARGATATELHQLLPSVPPPAGLDSDEGRFRLFDAVGGLLRECAARAPIVLVLDDLQWADESSLLLLVFLARELGGTRLLIVGAYRDVEARLTEAAGRRLAELACEATTIRLAGLAGDAVAALVERATGGPAAEALTCAIGRATGGNPLFVEELLRTMALTEGFDAGAVPALPLPDRVRAVIGRRTTLVSPACRRLLRVASVLGTAFDPAVVERLVRGTSPAEAASDEASRDAGESIDEAIAAGILTGVPARPAFAHDLFRETIYDDLPPRERAGLHAAVGATLEQLYAGALELRLPELARHFFLAGPAQGDKAAAYAVRAAERAAAGFAHAEAVAHYRQALAARPAEAAERCRMLLALGESLWSTGEYDEARRVHEEAAELADALGLAPELARAAVGFGGPDVSFDGGVVEPRLIRLLEHALAHVGESDGVLRASLMARLAAALAFSDERARGQTLAKEAVAMARRLGDRRTLHLALSCAIAVTWGPDELDERLAMSRETTTLAIELGGVGLAEMHGALMTTLLESGDVARAEREAEAYRRRTASAGRRIPVWFLAVRRAMMALLEGRLAEAEALATHALNLGSARSQNAAQYYGAQLLALRREQGRLAEMLDAIAGCAASYPAVPAWRATLAWAHAELGHDADARRELERLAAADFTDLPRDMFWLLCLWLSSDVAAHLGDVRRSAALYALLLPYRTRCVTSGAAFCGGSVERPLGVLATVLERWDAAASHFEAALAVHERLGARPWVAHTEHEYARMLLARGRASDRADALARLQRAEASARALGMVSLGARVERLLADLPPPSRDSGEEAVLRQEGEYWTLAWRDVNVRLRDARGLRLIALLLASPGREFHAVELAAWPGPPPAVNDVMGAVHDAGLRTGALAGDDTAPDAEALRQYRARLLELQEDADEAERFNDPFRATQAREEIARIAELMSTSVRTRGRQSTAHVERARLSVTKAIRYALRKIERADPSLGDLLAATVKTGTACRYQPDPRTPVRWVL